MQSGKLYPSTKFVALRESDNTDTRRRNYTLWIFIIMIISLLLSCSSSVSYYLRKLTTTAHLSDDVVYNKAIPQGSFSIPKLWLRTNSKTSQDFCHESHQLDSIPANIITQINNDESKSLHNYITMALLLQVERLIGQHERDSLRIIFNDCNRKLKSVRKFEHFADFLTNINSNQVKFSLKFLKSSMRIADFGDYFALVEELTTWYNYLHLLEGYLSTYEQQRSRELYVNVTEVNFYKFTTETQAKVSHFVYSFNLTRKKIAEINDVIQEWLKPVEIQAHNKSYILTNKVILLSDIKQKMADADTAYIFCGHTLYLDEDVILPGVNLGIISPRWVFLKKVTINLNGVDGSAHEDTARGIGKPGNPGSSGGDFFGVGNWDEEWLIISANGGKGGNGQNGAKGCDGFDYTHPAPPLNKPNCMIKINSFRNSYKQMITRYKIFSDYGCGGTGKDGGVGGMGGKPGKVILINESVKIVKGLIGRNGSPGKGGAGGVGGKDGCFFEVFDVNDEILHRISNVKCTPGIKLPSGKPGKDNHNRVGLTQPPEKLNLSVCDCIVNFIRNLNFNNKDPKIASTLLKLTKYNVTSRCILQQYNEYKKRDIVEMYQILKNNANTKFKFLHPLLLARILILKTNIDYYFIDDVIYLNLIERSIKSTNEQTRELQPVTYLKKKLTEKGEKLGQNLKSIKSKLINSREFAGEKELTCVTLTTIDAMLGLINQPNVQKIKKLHSLIQECITPEEYVIDVNTEIILPQNEKFKVLVFESDDVEEYLQKLKSGLEYLKNLLKLVGEKRKLLGEVVDELEHLMALCEFTEWEESVELLLQSLESIMNATEKDEKTDTLKTELLEALIMLQYKLAEDAMRQKVHPFHHETHHWVSKDINVEEILKQIKLFRESSNSSCRNEVEAYFGKNSAVGEFYSWSNAHVRSDLEELFSGAEIRLKSSLINRHALDKNFIRFKSLKLEFDCRNAEREKFLRDILLDYKVVITHSGYSHYNWIGEDHVVMSDEVTFEYSFKTRENGEPELFNALYKRLQDGTIMLSPYTTYTIRLLHVNERANYHDLMPFVDDVSLKLTGIGTFIP